MHPKQLLALCGCRKRPLLYTVIAVVLLLVLMTRWNGVFQNRFFSLASEDSSLVGDTGSLYFQQTLLNGQDHYKNRKIFKTKGIKSFLSKLTRDTDIQSSSNIHFSGKYRYVLGMNYWEQFNMAVRNFFKLACVAEQWNASVTMPFTAHSRLYGLSDLLLDDYINTTDAAYNLDLILNTGSLDSVLRENGLHSMTGLEDFLRFGDRKLVFLHFISVKPAREYKILSRGTNLFLTSAFQKTGVVNCAGQPELIHLSRLVASNLNSRFKNLTGYAQQMNPEPFHTHQYYCLNMSRGFTPGSLASNISLKQGNVSIVVINWRGTSNGGVVRASAKGIHLSNRIIIRDRCLNNSHSKPLGILFSRNVLSSSERFKRELGVLNNQYIVVHIRSEKMFLRQARFPRLLHNCVHEGLEVRDKLLSESVGEEVLYFGDIGPFGTETCKNCRAIGQFKRVLTKYKVELTHFYPSQYNLLADNGFVAAVEMTLMSHASHLILIGGGAFQSQLQLQFDEYHSSNGRLQNPAIRVCATDRQAHEITQRFSSPRVT